MSDKRFTDVNVDFEESWIMLKDNGDFLIFPISFNDKEEYGLETLEDLLNGLSDKIEEQQTTISQLKQEIGEWKKENRKLLDQIQEFERIPKSIRGLWVE